MIGSSFLSSNSACVDSFLSKELNIEDNSFLFGVDFQENEFSSVGSVVEWGQSSCSVSPVHSSSSSDDCDWSTFDDINSMLPITDNLASKLLEETLIDELDLNDLDWVSLEDSNSEQTNENNRLYDIVSTTKTSRKKKKSSKLPEYLGDSKSWSQMSFEERLKTAHALSKVISQQMGLREQIEVIKLIDPSTVLTPNTTEYAINLSQLNNSKLKRIKEYVKKHAISLANSEEYSSFIEMGKKDGSSCPTIKRKQRRFKHPYLKELKQRQKKVIKQDKKEKRSGLFIKEKIIKKLSVPQEEDEDVNILDDV